MRNLVFMSALIILLVAIILPACAKPQEENTIRVAIVGPMQFIQGEHHWMGATMGAEEINNAGGVNVAGKNYKIQLIKVETNELLDVAGAASAVERAITVDKADLIMGGFRTEAVFPMSDVAMDNKKLFFNCGAATGALQERVADNYDRYKYFFKMTPYNETFLVTSDFKMLAMVGERLKQELGIEKPRIAVIVEKLEWTQKMVLAAKVKLPQMGFEVVGVWQPSDTATDVTAELTAIAKADPHIIFTTFSGPVGITYAKQRGELKIPAVSAGIIVEAQKKDFWEATGGKANHEIILNVYPKGIAVTPNTIPFFEEFERRTGGQWPIYTAGTYEALLAAKQDIEKAQTLDPDALVPIIEQRKYEGVIGIFAYYPMESPPPKFPHDIVYGPDYITGVGTQWLDGQAICVWPKKEYGTVDDYGDWRFEYPGTVPFVIAPEVLAKFKK